MSKIRQARGLERRWARGHREEQLELHSLEHAIAAEYRLAADTTWSKAERTALADELLGAIVHCTAAEHIWAGGIDCWDKQRGLLEKHAHDLVLWSLDFRIATHRECRRSAVAAAKHMRSQGQETAAQTQDANAREHDDTVARLERQRQKAERLGVPADVVAAVDKRIPKAAPELRDAQRREDERVQTEWDRAGELVDKLHAAEAAAGLPPQTCALDEVPADIVAIAERNVVWDDALLPNGWGLFHDWLARRSPAGKRAP